MGARLFFRHGDPRGWTDKLTAKSNRALRTTLSKPLGLNEALHAMTEQLPIRPAALWLLTALGPTHKRIRTICDTNVHYRNIREECKMDTGIEIQC